MRAFLNNVPDSYNKYTSSEPEQSATDTNLLANPIILIKYNPSAGILIEIHYQITFSTNIKLINLHDDVAGCSDSLVISCQLMLNGLISIA